jgi:hypothetical protein
MPKTKLPTLADMTTAKLARAAALQARAVRVAAALKRGRVSKAHVVLAKATVVLAVPKRYTEVERAQQAIRVAHAKRRAAAALA